MGAEFHADAAGLPREAGAYVLVVELANHVTVRLPGRPDVILPPGRYLYCGSARGPGGIKARVGRHMRRDKADRWHIDQLTTAGTVLGVWVFGGGDECDLVSELAGFPAPIPGFGSSDCRNCTSHLLAWPTGVALPVGCRSN